jgi:hypothetical protein
MGLVEDLGELANDPRNFSSPVNQDSFFEARFMLKAFVNQGLSIQSLKVP